MDFFQNGSITTLHKLCQRPIEQMEAELQAFSVERPMALILPSLYSELEGPALKHIVDELCSATYISEIIVGLDQADEKQFEHAKEFFSVLPQNVHVLWNDGPWLREIDAELSAQDLAPTQPGKGRNAWYCMGYALALEHCEAIALHDCDILTYDRSLPARLFYPVANPAFSFDFCKGYYARINGDRLSGRVTRLFVTPLLRALKKVVGQMDYLDFMDSFRYPLSGEFSLSRDFVKILRIPSDWGLEVGVLSEVYRTLSRNSVCQVDIADQYDHKHQDLSEDDANQGLARMSIEIAKSLYRKLATEGVTLSNEDFRSIKAAYYRIALDTTEQ
ncbi:MAG: glycosyl transferase, partial [Gammaproteobacteria bacterium]|nr:glycosyl transferase [Gammaproteobacteria bacterium]